MQNLFSPFSIKNCFLKNRIVMPGLASFLIENDGSYSEKTIEHYRLRAAGGPAMIIMEAHGVAPEGVVSNHQARIYDDKYIKDISRAASVIKNEGCIPAIQIHHAGRQVPSRVINRRPFAPSHLPCPSIKGEVEPLSIKGIEKIIIQFGDAAERAKAAGFELIEIHGAHGYLINQFLSGFSNVRDDEYGGTIEKRSKFAREIIREVRKRVGRDFPLSFKISAQEFVPAGLSTGESIEILRLLIPEGLDIIQVSAGNDATPEWISQSMFMKQACLIDSAEKIKSAINIPVMVVGRINDPVIADKIIKENRADLVCMGRGLLADPELPVKAKQGRLEDIRKCIACNTCMQSIFRNGKIECLVNPVLGREKELVFQQAEKPKNVLIVGGGPGGLNTAVTAAKRGHFVNLYEKNSELGGQLLFGIKPYFKKELNLLLEYLLNQIKKEKINCHLNHEITLEEIIGLNPDVVIIATGSKPFMPPISGINSKNVMTVPEILNIADTLNSEDIIVLGGGSTGCEVALDLSQRGCRVTIVEQLSKIGREIEAITKKMIFNGLKNNRVEILTEHTLQQVTPDEVHVADKNSNVSHIRYDKLVVSTGNKPDDELYNNLKNKGIEVYLLGDCLQARGAKEAIYEAALIGSRI
ncbi:MAG: FAD-dependent oxidoreductase [Deltaproteobacteria bacterium]|nr:FAD-dependent oxidoreductase [Deltaproteobacteria bacterium]